MIGAGDGSLLGEAAAAGRGAVKSSLRTLQILELLSAPVSELSVTEVARDLGIPKSSAHGLLQTMVARGWLKVDASGAKYSLGIRAVVVCSSYLEQDLVVETSKEVLDELAAVTGEAVHLGRLDGEDVVYLAKRESRHGLRLYSVVGRRLPAHATALGKVLLASLPDSDVKSRLPARLMPLTDNTITSQRELLDELDAIRHRGYAVDNGESDEGVDCLAIALTAPAAALSAISCSFPKARMSTEGVSAILTALRASTHAVDELLRYARST